MKPQTPSGRSLKKVLSEGIGCSTGRFMKNAPWGHVLKAIRLNLVLKSPNESVVDYIWRVMNIENNVRGTIDDLVISDEVIEILNSREEADLGKSLVIVRYNKKGTVCYSSENSILVSVVVCPTHETITIPTVYLDTVALHHDGDVPVERTLLNVFGIEQSLFNGYIGTIKITDDIEKLFLKFLDLRKTNDDVLIIIDSAIRREDEIN